MTLLGLHTNQDRKNIAHQHRDIHLFLKIHPAGVLATTDPNGSPHAAVIYFSVDSSLTITFLTKKNTRKSENLTHNNHAMLAVFDTANQTSAQITGLVSKVIAPDELDQVFRNTLRASLHEGRSAVPPITKLSAGDYIAYRLTPTQVRYSNFGPPEVGKRNKMFKTLDLPL